MTIKEAIKEANNRPINSNLNYYVSKWNDGYILHPTSYIKRHPDTLYDYSTLKKQNDKIINRNAKSNRNQQKST